ncbi:MAG: NUDIX domain-containing protein [Candidatus Thorarchaeota archaeon]|nr:NUDIX domain-containing protein [Candidatus Thorarchaeota archaeon]
MKFREFFENARSKVTILGTNPLIPHLEQSASYFVDFLTLNDQVELTILYESDSENFGQSLCLDTNFSENRISFPTLGIHRDRIGGKKKKRGLLREILDHVPEKDRQDQIAKQIKIRQINLRLPVNLILADNKLWYCITTNSLPTLDSYILIEEDSALYDQLTDFLEFYTQPEQGGIYLSEPEEELIQVYDRGGYPRGIAPRACFYTTAFQRHSIWGLIFNRSGKLLLHQRSMTTKDGRGLWDKSLGGHVDLGDSSTYITARRELVEELFLPEAEFTRYVRADFGDIINYGEWNLDKRIELSFKDAFSGLDETDWIMLRAVDKEGEPLTVTRVSQRRMHDKNDDVSFKRTIFMSDVYLFIAPPGYLDNEDQMKNLFALAEKKGAAQSHRLVSADELSKWIEEEEAVGRHLETFTDDLLYINVQYKSLLEKFSEFVQYVFRSE